MKGYKGFEKGLVCRGKQYSENTVFEELDAEICEKGMHFCENPFDVLDHYSLLNDEAEFNDFAEVEALDDVKTDDFNKYCTKKLRVGSKLSFSGFVKACVNFAVEKTKVGRSSGYMAKIVSSGDWAQIGSSGYMAQIGSSGDRAQIGSSGKNSVICCAGNGCKAKAKTGSWITLAEWKEINGEYTPVCVKTERVDGVRIRGDTYYKLENGEFVEA